MIISIFNIFQWIKIHHPRRRKIVLMLTNTARYLKKIMKVVNITEVMIKLQFKLPQALISRGFTRRTVFHAPAFQQKEINRYGHLSDMEA